QIVGRAPRDVGEIDVVMLGDLAEDVLPDLLLGDAPAPRLHKVTQRQLHAVLGDAGVHGRRQVRVEDHELAGRLPDALFGRLDDVRGVARHDLEQQLFRFLPFAFERDQDGYLVPDVFEALTVVRYDVGQHFAVGDVDDAAGALVGVHPVTDLVQGELEHPHVDH